MQPVVRCLALSTFILAWPTVLDAETIPAPESVLRAPVGADFFLASYEESMDYFHRLAEASDRIELRKVGKTSFGRDWYLAIISSPANLSRLEEIRATAQRLAHPEGLSDDEARRLARDGKAVIHIDGGLHATEVATAQFTIQLAYDLAVAEGDPEIQAILDNVVLLLWPSLNPDGQTMVADWYRQNLGGPYEVAPMTRLYQKYIGHDNNRDGYMLNTHESRVATRVIREWEPQVLYNHHQTSPFPSRIWIPPFAEPISEFVHPLMWRTVNLIGMSMAQALEERGQEGAVHMGTGFDNWYPGFIDHANNFHNVAAFLTETGLYRYATPHFYTIEDFPEESRDLRPQSLYASPWEGGWWRLRDAVDYMLTASISVLDVGAKYKTDLLYNRYQAGRDVIASYRANPPYAYFIPQQQRDPVAAVELLRRLAFNGIEVSQLTQQTNFEGQSYPQGTWVIPMDQPFAHFARQLFAVQTYPDLRQYPEGPPDQPYDVAGWTLQYQMGVRVVAATSPLTEALRGLLEPVRGTAEPWHSEVADAARFDSPRGVGYNSHPVAAAITPPAGRATGSGSALLLDPAQNNSYRALNQAWAAGAKVTFVTGKSGAKGESGESGQYAISGLNAAKSNAMVRDLALQARRAGATGTELTRPRIGLYQPWDPSIDEGWTRWLLERYDFEITSLSNAEIVASNLQSRFDVIVIADISADDLLEGFPKGRVPPRYVGGLAGAGVRALDAFVRAGGTLVTLNQSTLFAIEQLHLPVENVVAGLQPTDFFMGGSILEMIVDPSHPVMAGMPERSKVFVFRSPVFTTTEGFEGAVIAKYAPSGSPLLSGYLLGEKHLQGYASALDVHHGKGHVILLGMRPQWRGQPFGTFRILFNAALYGSQLADLAAPESKFWSSPATGASESDSDGDD
ncbi:MAG: M14 metallopeptidase family protein [Acidobacteriota bacterium]